MHAQHDRHRGWNPFWAALGAALLVLVPLVGGTGIWFAPVISEALCAVMAVWFLRRFLKKTAA